MDDINKLADIKIIEISDHNTPCKNGKKKKKFLKSCFNNFKSNTLNCKKAKKDENKPENPVIKIPKPILKVHKTLDVEVTEINNDNNNNFNNIRIQNRRKTSLPTSNEFKYGPNLTLSCFPTLKINQSTNDISINNYNKINRKVDKALANSMPMFLSLPIILITDTASMHTSIIDLATFEPEPNRLNSTESILRYYFDEK